jgi:cytochrome b561
MIMALSPERYSKIQVALHWGTLLLLIVSYVSSDWIKPAWRAIERGADAIPDLGGLAHIWFGVAILALTLVRIAIRLSHGTPAEPANTPRLQGLLAKAAHYALYGLLIAVPGAGGLAWFGGISNAAGVHEILFNIAMVVLGLHVAAALYHQFFLKDGLINRMGLR